MRAHTEGWCVRQPPFMGCHAFMMEQLQRESSPTGSSVHVVWPGLGAIVQPRVFMDKDAAS